MKIRLGFVSNSSSSSFIVEKSKLTEDQIYKIINHFEYANMKKLSCGYMDDISDKWQITETETHLLGNTWMDNFSMHDFFEQIGIDSGIAEWGS